MSSKINEDIEMNPLIKVPPPPDISSASVVVVPPAPPPPDISSTSVKVIVSPAPALRIQPEKIQTIKYTRGAIRDRGMSLECRVLEIEECPNVNLNQLITPQIVNFFYSLPKAFVIIFKHDEISEISDTILSKIFNRKRPMVISFESTSGNQFYYKNHGRERNFKEVIESVDENMDNFGTLLSGFNGKLLDFSASNEKLLMNKAAKTMDFVSVRFLNLFDSKLNPKLDYAKKIIIKDFEKQTLDGFSTLFDCNFMDLSNDELKFDLKLSNSTQHERELIFYTKNKMNLLTLSVKCRNKSAIKIFINLGLDVNLLNDNSDSAADIAYKNKDFDAIFSLISANSRYPNGFNADNIDVLTGFINDMSALHEIVKINEISGKNYKEMDEFIEKYPNLQHFYTVDNTSLVTAAIMSEKFDLVGHLMSKGIYIGPSESMDAITKNLSEERRQKLRLIFAKYLQEFSNNYLPIFFANSWVCHDNRPTVEHREAMRNAFQCLNNIADMKPILKICAAHRNFKIIFDFNRKSIEYVNPEVNKGTFGVYHPEGCTIYIGAKQLLDESTKITPTATLAHELTHLAMMLTYENDCKPYKPSDWASQESFNTILMKYKDNNNVHQFVHDVFNYDSHLYHAELIVRANHMTVQYHEDENELAQIKETHAELFKYYKTNVLLDVTTKQVDVEKKFKDKMIFANGVWKKRRRYQKFKRCTIIIAPILLIIILGLIGLFVVYFDLCLLPNRKCKWQEWSQFSHNRFMDRDITYQNEKVKFRSIFEGDFDALNSLDDKQLRNVKEISINSIFNQPPNPFIEGQWAVHDAINYFVTGQNYSEYRQDDMVELDKLKQKRDKFVVLAGGPLEGKTSQLRKMRMDWKNSKNFIAMIEFKEVDPQLLNQTITSYNNLMEFLCKAAKFSKVECEIFKKKYENREAILFIDGIDSIFLNHENFTRNLLESLAEHFYNKIELWISTRSYYKNDIEMIFSRFAKTNDNVDAHDESSGDDNDDLDDYDENIDDMSFKRLPLTEKSRKELFVMKLMKEIETHSNLPEILKDSSQSHENDQKSQFSNSKYQSMSKQHKNYTVFIENSFKIFEDYCKKIEIDRGEYDIKIDNIYLLNELIDQFLRSEKVNLFAAVEDFVKASMKDSLFDIHLTESKLESEIHGRNNILLKLTIDKIRQNFANDFINVNMSEIYATMKPFEFDASHINHEVQVGLITKDKEFINPLFIDYFVAKFIADDVIYLGSAGRVDEERINFLFNIGRDVDNTFEMVRMLLVDKIEALGENNKKMSEKFRKIFENELIKFDEANTLDRDGFNEFLMKLFANDGKMIEIIRKNVKKL